MSKADGAYWHCPNRDCNWSMVSALEMEGEAPRCVCGILMEKRELLPVFSYMDFLRGEEHLGADEE